MNRLKQILFTLLALPALVSCDNDTLPVIDGQGQPVTLSVSLDKGAMSRAAISPDSLDKENFIINGDYGIILGIKDKEGNLGYPNVHCCRFTNDRKGLIYQATSSGDTKEVSASPLKWSDAEIDKKDFKFILDNMGYQKTCTWNSDTEFLGWEWSDDEKNKTYAAQEERYAADNNKKPLHTNDIIWGRDTAKYDISGKSSFVELTHRMTRINVVFVNLENTLKNQAERKEMTVSIANLVLAAESFNRFDGTVSIADNPVRDTLQLKGKGTDLLQLGNQTDEENNSYVEYGTPNFILPPQPLAETQWPKVVVTYKKEGEEAKTVSGLIPHEILYESSGNDQNSSWVKLDRLRAAQHLTIVVEIKEGTPDIIFTAKVKEWVGIGPMTVVAAQRKPGINNIEELKKAIRMYNSLPVFKDGTIEVAKLEDKLAAIDDRMLLYGTPETVTKKYNYFDKNENVEKEAECSVIQWTFPINFSLNGYEPKPGFRNIMWELGYKTDYTVAYSYPIKFTGENTEVDLENLKGGKGIYNLEDLKAMITVVNSGDPTNMNLYGEREIYPTPSEYFEYTFDLRNNITFNAGELSALLKRNIGNKVYFYTMIDNGFEVNGSNDVMTLIEGNKEQVRPGINTLEDLNAMIAAVNSNILGSEAQKYGALMGIDNANKTATYIIDLWADIKGKIVDRLPVSCLGYKITYVLNDNGHTINGSNDVNSLVNGIYSADDWNAMVALVKSLSKGTEADKYGHLYIDGTSATYTFNLCNNINDSSIQNLPKAISGVTMTYVMNNPNGFTVNGETDANKITE